MCSNNCCCVRDQNFIMWPFLGTSSGGCVLNGWIITHQPCEPHQLITDWWARGVATGCELGTDRRVGSFHVTHTRAAVFRSPSNPPNNRAPLQCRAIIGIPLKQNNRYISHMFGGFAIFTAVVSGKMWLLFGPLHNLDLNFYEGRGLINRFKSFFG